MAIQLNYDDPTVFAVCSGACNQHGPGRTVANYFAKAYTVRRWKKNPACDNCKSAMTAIYEIQRHK